MQTLPSSWPAGWSSRGGWKAIGHDGADLLFAATALEQGLTVV